MDATTTQLRQDFFNWLFEEAEGFVCICYAPKDNPRKNFKQQFFHWPEQREALSDFVESHEAHMNLWFCVNLLEKPERRKKYTKVHNVVWCDLDTCNPQIVEPTPSIVIRSSPDRYQALWKLSEDIPPEIAEDYSKRIAYKYVQSGADPSGWDLTQLLRVPFTKNMKYEESPLVLIASAASDEAYSPDVFEEIEKAPAARDETETSEAPELQELPNPEHVIYKYSMYLERDFHELYEIEPDHSNDWSARLWKLINLAFEAGMEAPEVFVVAYHAKCNKYVRDRRPTRYLWREVLKAEQVQKKINVIAGEWEPLLMPELLPSGEFGTETFIDRYREWASASTDAVESFHNLSAAVLLSATLASRVKLEARYGTLIPNLWGLVLGESTLTRKTTAMAMAISILTEVDSEAILATDGSAEGLLTGLSNRPGRVSVFYKDEVSGFFDAINRKDYLAGMPETLTQLYDVPPVYRRILRKEQIIINEPIFIFFGGGIRDKVYSLLSDEYILSGFLPRFLVVTGNTDLSRIQPTGPRSQEGFAERQRLVNELVELQEQYKTGTSFRIGDQVIELDDLPETPKFDAKLTQESWELYAAIEMKMVEAGSNSHYSMLALPTFERLSRSILKLAILLAASRQSPQGMELTVEPQDIVNSARFAQSWGRYAVELIVNVGTSQTLRVVEKVRRSIERRPGAMKSEVMRAHHLSSDEMKKIIATLVDRGEINVKRKGRSEQYWVIA